MPADRPSPSAERSAPRPARSGSRRLDRVGRLPSTASAPRCGPSRRPGRRSARRARGAAAPSRRSREMLLITSPMPARTSASGRVADEVEVDDDGDRHAARRRSPCPRRCRGGDRRADAVVREVGRDRDHRQARRAAPRTWPRRWSCRRRCRRPRRTTRSRRSSPSSIAASRVPPATREDLGVAAATGAITLGDPVALARRRPRPPRSPPVEIRPSASSPPRSAMAPAADVDRTAGVGTQSGLVAACDLPAPSRGRRGCRPRPTGRRRSAATSISPPRFDSSW